MRGLVLTTLSLVVLAGPAAGQEAERLTFGGVFADATMEVKLAMVALLLAALGSLAAWILGLARPAARAGALNYLKGVRIAAPLGGVTCGAFVLLMGFIAAAKVRPAPDLTVMAPGFAEVTLAVMLGFLAATIAPIGERHLTGRAIAPGA